ncbi:hypothetical protein [Bradyrhizobium sp. SZCCHNS3051]|uniref:hypothetical protein n=1 Tax=Bradyrhizobium sp. SZCCHNS3051 TaxID=3057320 RepID=UPI002916CF0D|nr:hypothetical protein [Bradyrhizobium sp. SZCCHNS3051]
MSNHIPLKDFRAHRDLLPDEAFALPSGERPGPTDLISEKVWRGIVHLPDDVALTTSNHHGAQLGTLYGRWADWIDAVDDGQEDELFDGMLEAADCFQASTFDSLHGFYRAAAANLRSALELIAIGALGNLAPKDVDYERWKERNLGSFPFSSCMKKLRGATSGVVRTPVLKAGGWPETLYEELCRFTHARPDASDGALWHSNGPVYVSESFRLLYTLQISTYAAGFVFAKIA